MYLDILETLARRIIAEAEKGNCLCNMLLVTNGYLLTKETIELLDEIGITRVQITIDGMKSNHDARRPLRNGDGTFERLISNLVLFCDSPIEVFIRMNVDNQNCTDFRQLKELLRGLGNSNIQLYASPVEDLNKDTVNEVSSFMTADEFEAFALNTRGEDGLSTEDFAVMDDRYYFCSAEMENCYVVDDLGDFYKCWDEVGRTEYRCFNIFEPENINYSIKAKYITDDPFSNEKCRNCVFLPLCFGGCKFQKASIPKTACGFTSESLEQYLEMTFLKK